MIDPYKTVSTNLHICVKKLSPTAKLPTRGSKYAAAYDLRANCNKKIIVWPHSCKKIGTGLAMIIPEGYRGSLYARSGAATKRGLRPANCVGVIDSDYRGEIIVAMHNDRWIPRIIKPNERIAQIGFDKVYPAEYEEVDELKETERGENGFGSTGRS